MVCGHGENDFVSESMNKSKQKSGEDDVRRLPLKRHSERGVKMFCGKNGKAER